ncbi:oxygen-independent coproporphyrinogen III oxidase [Synechocystis sp. LKSZ1]|uniref:oxygen-independent coproporphyrinogen III oxidase n=1 Tax=Synechocystis sp. LKSZ1 TaxID=3144951 RepID=UPI00336BDF36
MPLTLSPLEFDTDLLIKYNQALPRYTSYPPATEFHAHVTEAEVKTAISASNARQLPLSLYFHLPFCHSACYFCGCNVIVSNNQRIAQDYLGYLHQEIQQKAQLMDCQRPVTQLHWGGGTPNYLNLEQVDHLWQSINQHFHLTKDAEVSIEINPRHVDKNYIFALRAMGFNRISFGIQDFNPQVQRAINREISEEKLFAVMDWIRAADFASVNVDLIYGLPGQTLASFRETIAKTVQLDPNRIAVFNFAYVPGLKAIQRKIDPQALPCPEEKLAILKQSITDLTDSGYVFIGMDHFAKPDDELALAQRQGTLKRNFQGYTTQPEAELFGFGLTSISMLDDIYFQNHKRLKDYYQAVTEGRLPLEKAVQLGPDDQLRRQIIMGLMCHFALDYHQIERQYHLNFGQYFAQELTALKPLAADGLLEIQSQGLTITPKGRLLIRNIAAVFDVYRRSVQPVAFSQTI